MLSGLGCGRQSPLVVTGPFIRNFFDLLTSLLCLVRRAQNEIQWQKTEIVGPAQGEHHESFQVLPD